MARNSVVTSQALNAEASFACEMQASARAPGDRLGAWVASGQLVSRRLWRICRDLVWLTKPVILLATILAAAVGAALASSLAGGDGLHGAMRWQALAQVLWVGLGMGLSVGCACTFNMLFEHDADRRMARTRRRPLAAGRLPLWAGALWAVLLGSVGLFMLFATNLLSACLGMLAFVSYVLIYTPLKRKTPFAFVVGLLPGALPILIGWTALAGEVSAPGLVLFVLFVFWQVPHALSISIYLQHDYARAQMPVMPEVFSLNVLRHFMSFFLVCTVLASVCVLPFAPRGWLYLPVACGSGLWALSVCLKGRRTASRTAWARGYFRASLIHISALLLALGSETLLF